MPSRKGLTVKRNAITSVVVAAASACAIAAGSAAADGLPQPHHLAAASQSAQAVTAARRYAAFWDTGDASYAQAALAPDFRAAVVLCDIEGLSYEEIGATLGVKLGTVRSRIHRGRQALRDYLAAHPEHADRRMHTDAVDSAAS